MSGTRGNGGGTRGNGGGGRRNRSPGRLLLGACLLALFKREGMREFGATPAAFLASLLPLLAFPFGEFLFGLSAGSGVESLGGLLAATVALLTPAVVSEALAHLWERDDAWLRYATAYNWTRWPMLLALSLGVGAGGILAGPAAGMSLGLVGVAFYGAALDWFVARVGLGLSGGRAILLVLAVNVAAGALFLGPTLLTGPSATMLP